ncbi:MAG: exo-alpha-sialidase [Opitutaceae bacterium]|nr:exo-alpha-sialidase [Opitutaceae bacterium]
MIALARLAAVLCGLMLAAPAFAALPSAPGDVRHTGSSPAHLRVSWQDRGADEAGYRIWRREQGTERWYLAGEVPANATHFDDGGMQHETSYEHKVAAFGASGESAGTVSAATRTPRMQSHLSPTMIRRGDDWYAGAPSAIGLRDGRLLLMYFLKPREQPRLHLNTSLWQMESADGGATWSRPRRLLEGNREVAWGKPALARLPDGSLGLTYSRFGLDAGYKIVARARFFMRSTDEAAIWSAPVQVSDEMSANNDTLIVGDRSRLLQALNSYAPAVQIAASDDLGATWRVLAQVSAKALPTGESALAHLDDGRLVFLSRHEAPFYFLSFSDDNGHAWSRSGTLYLGGGDNPPKLARIPGTDVLVAVVHSWHVGRRSKDRRQLASVISRDGGRTWDNFRLLGHFPDGKDGFLQHSLTFVGNMAYIFYGGGSNNDTNDGTDLRMLRVTKGFFLSTAPWPYDGRGQEQAARQ